MALDPTRCLKINPKDGPMWAAWYRDLYPKLLFRVYRFTAGDSEAARDILQESGQKCSQNSEEMLKPFEPLPST